jgi:hypothetical protein
MGDAESGLAEIGCNHPGEAWIVFDEQNASHWAILARKGLRRVKRSVRGRAGKGSPPTPSRACPGAIQGRLPQTSSGEGDDAKRFSVSWSIRVAKAASERLAVAENH